MLAITVKNKSLELSPETEISLVHSCPLFDRVRVSRVFSFPFKIPLSPQNLKALQYASRFDAKDPWRGNTAQIRGAGEIESGELVVTASRPDFMEVVFRNAPIDIADRLKEIRINTILEEVPVPVTSPPALVCLSLFNVDDIKEIEIGGITFQLSQAEWESMTTLQILQYFETVINAQFPGMASVANPLLCLDSAQVNETTPRWSTMLGFAFHSYVTVGEFRQTNMINFLEDLFDDPDERFFFPTLSWENFYGDNPIVAKFINHVFSAEAAVNEKSAEKEWQYTYLPFVRVKYVIEKISEQLGVSIDNFWDDPDFSELYLPNNYCVDFLYKDYQADMTFKYLNGFQATVNLNRHVPDMSAGEFLQRLCEGLNLTVDFRNGGMYFRRGISYITSPPQSVEVDMQVYDFKVMRPKGLYLYFDLSRELYAVAGQLQPYVIAPEERRRQMAYAIFFMDSSYVYLKGTIRCPHTNQKGVSSASGGGNKSDLPLYLVFNRGQANSNSGETYLYATSDNKNASGTIVYNWSLDLNGNAGVVATQFGPLIGAEDRPTLDIPAVMPIERFSILKKFTNARIRFFSPNGEVTAIITSMKTAVGITDTEVRVDLSLLIL